VLLVEDNAESRANAEDELIRQIPDAQIVWAGDAQTAMAYLDDLPFDLAVCDLKIPARPGDLTTDESNGVSIVSSIQERHPGTPIVILSGWGTIDNTEPYTASAEVLPAHGVPNLRMCQAANKGTPDGFANRLSPIRQGLANLATVHFEAPDDLDYSLKRAIAQFAADRGLSEVEVTRAGGLSGSANAIVMLRGEGKPVMRAFVKANDRVWLLDELRRQREFVEGYLDSSNWAHTIETLKAGLKDRAVYFSSLASNPSTYFQIASSDEPSAVAVIEKIERALEPWQMGNERMISIGELRRSHITNEVVESHGVSLEEFAALEAEGIRFRVDVVHGDLHGENVLVVEESRPLLVDFAYTEVAPGVLDPVTLEMGFLFHPESPLAASDDLRLDQWAQGEYLVGDRYAAVLKRCRDWALTGRTQEEFFAMSYAHAMRHLKRGIPTERVLAVARSAAHALGH
jgi:CheY-like chemotaxis protein